MCEQKRAKLNHSILDSPIQTKHIGWDKDDGEWNIKGIKKIKNDAENNNRLFIPFHQRNQDQWNSLTWQDAFEDFEDLINKCDIVPISIPINSSLDEWLSYREDAITKLKDGKILMPIICSKHEILHFEDIINYEDKNSILFGISCFHITDTTEKLNLMTLKSIQRKLKQGDSCALAVCFNHERVMSSFLQVAGTFGFSCFGFDVFSQTHYFKFYHQGMEEQTPDKLYLYDNMEKKFTKSEVQKQRYGFDINNSLIDSIPLSEGLDYREALKYLSHKLQQKDLDLINEKILEKQPVMNLINDYTGWNVFWETALAQTTLQS